MAAKVARLGKATLNFTKTRGGSMWKYAKVEMKPPSFDEFPQIKQSINNIIVGAKTQKFMKMPVKEVWLNTLVCTEIMCMFFIGEIIGKGSVIGYWIPGAWSIHGEDSRTWAPECQKKN